MLFSGKLCAISNKKKAHRTFIEAALFETFLYNVYSLCLPDPPATELQI